MMSSPMETLIKWLCERIATSTAQRSDSLAQPFNQHFLKVLLYQALYKSRLCGIVIHRTFLFFNTIML